MRPAIKKDTHEPAVRVARLIHDVRYPKPIPRGEIDVTVIRSGRIMATALGARDRHQRRHMRFVAYVRRWKYDLVGRSHIRR